MSGARERRQIFLFDKALFVAKKKSDGSLLIKVFIEVNELIYCIQYYTHVFQQFTRTITMRLHMSNDAMQPHDWLPLRFTRFQIPALYIDDPSWLTGRQTICQSLIPCY
jgi:hypothetical protein